MKTFRNANFVKRDYECANVVACQSEQAPAGNQWVEADEGILAGLSLLFRQGGAAFYGYM